MKKIIFTMIFFCMLINVSLGYTLTVNGFSRNGVEANREVTLKAVEKEGSGFLGWEVVTGDVTLANPESMEVTFLMPEGDVNIITNYTASSRLTVNPGGATYTGGYNTVKSIVAPLESGYTVTYNYNGNGTPNSSETVSKVFSSWSLVGGGRINEPLSNPVIYTFGVSDAVLTANYSVGSVKLPSPTRPGYKFSGWYTSEVGGVEVGKANDSYTPSKNITLYAHWELDKSILTVNPGGQVYEGNYNETKEVTAEVQANTVTYNYNGGVEALASETVEKTFTGWILSGDGSISSKDSNPTTYTYGLGSGTLTAVYSNKSVTLPETTRSGYIFKGWYTEETGGVRIGKGNATYVVTQDITLYAQWTLGNYEIDTSPVSYAESLSEAVAKASSGNTITLTQNVLETELVTVPVGININLELEGNTITTANSNFITVRGGLTIKDSYDGKIESTAVGGNVINVLDSGALTVTGGTIFASGDTSYGIYSSSPTSTVTLGIGDGEISDVPVIIGKSYGIYSPGKVNYYDGRAKGMVESIHASVGYIENNRIIAEGIDASNYMISDLILPHVTTNLTNYYDAKYNGGASIYYTTSETFADLQKNNNGNINGAYWEGNSLNFDGVDDWVNLGEINYSYPTLEAVFTADVAYGNIISNEQDGGYSLGFNEEGKLVMSAYVDGIVREAISPTILETGRKYHAVGTYDGTAVRLYLDGIEVATTEIVGNISAANSTVLALGANPSGTSAEMEYLDGNIYLARVYNGTLTAAEVAQNYNASIRGKDTHDIHEGATVSNDGVCAVCGGKYVNINSFKLPSSTSYTAYLDGIEYAEVMARVAATSTLDQLPIAVANGPISLGTVSYNSSDTSIATYADGVISGLAGGMPTVTATAGSYSASVKAYVYNAKLTTSTTSSKYMTYETPTSGVSIGYINANAEEGFGSSVYAILNNKTGNRYQVYGIMGGNAQSVLCGRWINSIASGNWEYYGI